MSVHLPRQIPAPWRPRRRGRGAAARGSRGFILGYIMMALLLLGVITAAISRLKDERAAADWVDSAQTTLRDDIQIIRTQVLLCAATASSDNAGFVEAMPQSADDTNGDALDLVQCSGTGQRLFDGTNTVFLPRPPEGFTPWRYVNDLNASGNIFVRTSTSDPSGVAAANRLSRIFGNDELSVATEGATATLTFFLRRPPAASP